MSDYTNIKQIIEACILTSDEPIDLVKLHYIFDNQLNDTTLLNILTELSQDYQKSGIELIKVAHGYRFRSKPEYQAYINKLSNVKPARYSRAVMETLSIIAYRQPITRGEIEQIRGVSINSSIIQTLFERGWIEVVGYKQLPGKPELLATTKFFLDDLGLNSLDDLPALPNLDNAFLSENQDFIEEYDQQKNLS